jgi:hypothetical protein
MLAGRKDRARWSAEEVSMLKDMLARQIDIRLIAIHLGRSERAVELKIQRMSIAAATPSDPIEKRSSRRRSGASFFLS